MQVGVGLPPSKLTLSNGNAAVVERNNAPSITTLTKVFFIDFSPWCAKITSFQFPLCFCITHNPLALLGISESGTDFPKLGIWRRGWFLSDYSLEHSQVNPVDLLKSHFGTVLRESSLCCPAAFERTVPYSLDDFLLPD